MTEQTEITKQRERARGSVIFVIFVCAVFLFSASCAGAREESAPLPARVAPALNEAELDAALQQTATAALGDREGAVIVIDPHNGRLRAVVNARLAFEQTFPPGSAIKPFTALAALRAGTLDRAAKYQCQTTYARAGFEIVCSHPKSNTPLKLPRALAYSCNDYFAHLAERLSAGNFTATLAAFGFGERTGVNATEAAGSLPRGDWHVRHALGESEQLLVTPLQLLAAYAALANGGHLYRPQRVAEQNLVAQESARLNIAPAQRDVLLEGMRGAVKYGTAAKAGLGDLPFYVFGKTGTSTASNGFRTQGWFVGFAGRSKPVGGPQPEQVELGVLVFLKRAHGAQCAEVARPILECGMGKGKCGVKQSALGTVPRTLTTGFSDEAPTAIHPVANAPGTAPLAQAVIRVHSVSENVTRELPLEEYLVGVLTGEASIENEFEALQAQAVASRSFALRNRYRHARAGYDFCSTTHCQRFVLPKARTAAQRAVAATTGEVLLDQAGQVADAYFHAACGGVTANLATLWGARAPDYLRGVRDEFCATMPHHRWEQTIAATQLAKALQTDARTAVGAGLKDIVVSKRDATGRAETIMLIGAQRRTVRGWDFKLIVGRSLGWQMIKSSRFEVQRVSDDFVFRGGGFGHGLGLCQEGTHAAARRGLNYRQILQHYFPSTRLSRRLSSLPLASTQSLALRAVGCGAAGGTRGQLVPISFVTADQRQTLPSAYFRLSFAPPTDRTAAAQALRILENARTDLLRRLQAASLSLPEPTPFEINIHATTDDFIAATGLSGWATGATRGRRIELQPLTLLQKRRVLATTLRHELTHAVIEVLSRNNAPRWLAEGLAIYVAGEGAALARLAIKNALTRDELERKLTQGAPAAEMRRLYAQAYREVRALIAREGERGVWQRVVKYRETTRA